MKKFGIAIGLALIFCVAALVGCTVNPQADKNGSSAQDPSEESRRESELWQDGVQKGPLPEETEGTPAVSSLAVLDTVDVSEAFGDRSAEGWSFALQAAGEVSASYGFLLNSEISGEDKANFECGATVGLEDLFGIRSQENGTEGVDLFGGGKAALLLNYRTDGGDPFSKSFEVGFRHDGDLIWFAGEGEGETQIALPQLKEKVQSLAMTETLKRMENAYLTIPEELKKGVSLRLAVEKLIDLGFTVEIDDSDGVSISICANEGFYTAMLNDLLEKAVPSSWLAYLPRADFSYERTVFNLKLSFDAQGIFREYSMTSDVALTASFGIRRLFYSESTLKVGGAFSICAFSGEISDSETDAGAGDTL